MSRATSPAVLLAAAVLCATCVPQTVVPRSVPSLATPSATPTATETPAPTATATPSPGPAPSPLISARGNVIVERPLAGARLTSPLTASGGARVFEAALVWRLVDVGGREITTGFTTTSAGAPEFGTFAFPIAFSISAETAAFVEVFSRSPRDGGVDELVRVRVTLLP